MLEPIRFKPVSFHFINFKLPGTMYISTVLSISPQNFVYTTSVWQHFDPIWPRPNDPWRGRNPWQLQGNNVREMTAFLTFWISLCVFRKMMYRHFPPPFLFTYSWKIKLNLFILSIAFFFFVSFLCPTICLC